MKTIGLVGAMKQETDLRKQKILRLAEETRKKLGMRYTPIEIVKTIHDKEKDRLYIIVGDRPDKTALIGPGGLVAAKLKENLGVKTLTVVSKLDLVVKRRMIKEHIKLLSKTDQPNVEPLKKLCRLELFYPPRRVPQPEKLGQIFVHHCPNNLASEKLAKTLGYKTTGVISPETELNQDGSIYTRKPPITCGECFTSVVCSVKKVGGNLLLANTRNPVFSVEDLLVVNLAKLLWLTREDLHEILGREPPPCWARRASLGMGVGTHLFVRHIIEDVSLGLLEPNQATREIYGLTRCGQACKKA